MREIDQRKRDVNMRMNCLPRPPVYHVECGSPDFMASYHFIECALEHLRIGGAALANGDRFVIKRRIGRKLRVQPDLLLTARKWGPFTRLPASAAFGLLNRSRHLAAADLF